MQDEFIDPCRLVIYEQGALRRVVMHKAVLSGEAVLGEVNRVWRELEGK